MQKRVYASTQDLHLGGIEWSLSRNAHLKAEGGVYQVRGWTADGQRYIALATKRLAEARKCLNQKH